MYKRTVQSRIRLNANFRRLRFNDTELGLMPNIDDQGMTQQPGTEDVQYHHTYKAYIGEFAVKEDNILEAAFTEGAEWEVLNDRKTGTEWTTWVVAQPVKETGLWREVIFTPALIA
ncbi:hypothetical protein D0962_17785 [Leptolyngbyaceae cyanobacterium CCMR0082]|uniref:Uncharacterized protein n=2 Tax=Adonisia TaxID=2950183 RepID=A0A6M0S8D2_9CYAN|nr:hypothetical protein [Adonisia turfae CCMR0082]